MKFELTDEQKDIVAFTKEGEDLVIEAYAGSSKSTTLSFIAKELHLKGKKGMYLAYNKAIAEESKGMFPESVDCRTVHSLAYSKLPNKLKKKVRYNNPFATAMAERYGFDSCFVASKDDVDDRKFVSVVAMWSMVKETVRHYCTSADNIIKIHHFAKLEWMSVKSFHIHNVEDTVIRVAKKYWDDMINPDTDIPLTHDAYLKLYSLGDDVPKVDYLMVDEANDVNAVMVKIIERFPNQTILVGDSFQNIYRFNRTVSVLRTFDAKKMYLTKSFRFGDNVESFTNEVLSVLGASKPLVGNGYKDGITYFIDVPNTYIPSAVLCRTNAGCIEALLEFTERYPELKISTTVDFKQISLIVNSYIALSEGDMKNVKHPLLYAFKNIDELNEYLQDVTFVDDLIRTCNLISRFGAKRLLAIILNLGNNKHTSDKVDILITTAHKSKGLGFDNVTLYKDFTVKNGYITNDEINLFYVAVTRAKKCLDLSLVSDHVTYVRENC